MKWGIIGAGKISTQFAEDGRNVTGIEMVAVATTRLETAQPFAEKFGIPAAYDDWRKLLADESIENIYIGSPHPFHREMVIACLQAGKNVLCEKPLGINAGEVRDMLAAAKESGKLLMEAMWSVFFPSLQKVKEIKDTNALGALHTVSTNMGYGGTKTRDRWRYYNDMAGGGLLDIGIYPIHALRYVFGKMPDRYTSFAKIANDVDVYSSILMEFDAAICTCTQTCYNDVDNFATFYFDRGSVHLNDRWFCSDTMIISEPGKPPRTETFPFNDQGMQYEIAAFEEAVKQGKTEHPLVSHQTTLDVVEMMDALRKDWGLVYPQDK